ncbi:MAG: hypothetical protein JSV86_06460 [Gemmatimonadota bacterium]|nr:MAG: hypothetical protein JSV86_06460 [Gemmatimonadota bacterium]
MGYRAAPGGGGGSGTPFDPAEWVQRNSLIYLPVGANQLGLTLLGTSMTAHGNGALRPVVGTGSFLQSLKRRGHQSNNVLNGQSGVYAPNGQIYFRGNAAGLGGFRFVGRFGVSQQNAGDMRFMCGMTPGAGPHTSTSEPSTEVNCFFVGADSSDTQLQVMHNDAAGNCTKVALGASFPWPGTVNVDCYQVELVCAVGVVTEMSYVVTRLDTGVVASGTVNSNLMTVNVLVKPEMVMNNGPTNAVATAFDTMGIYCDNQNGVVP